MNKAWVTCETNISHIICVIKVLGEEEKENRAAQIFDSWTKDRYKENETRHIIVRQLNPKDKKSWK